MQLPNGHIKYRWRRADSDARWILRGKDFDQQYDRCGKMSKGLRRDEWKLLVMALKVRDTNGR